MKMIFAVGCGAFREKESDKVEIKRMFVHPDFRKKGIASAVLRRTGNLGERSWLYGIRFWKPEKISRKLLIYTKNKITL
jgi:GNAT superfamily N-acetyltransferase